MIARLFTVVGLMVAPLVLWSAPALADGGSFNDPLPLEAGTTRDRLGADDTRYFLTPVEQSGVTVRVLARPDAPLPVGSLLRLWLLDDARQPLGEPESASFPGDSAAEVEVTLPPGTVPGGSRVFAVLDLISGDGIAEGAGTYDVDIAVAAGDGEQLVEEQTVGDRLPLSGPVDPGPPAADATEDEDSALVGVAAIVLFGAAAVLVVRTLRRSRQDRNGVVGDRSVKGRG